MNEMYDWFSEGAWERFWRAWAFGSPPCHARNFTMRIEIIKNESVFSRLKPTENKFLTSLATYIRKLSNVLL
jgi:hypothetical protein